MMRSLTTALRALTVLTLLTGVAYPLAVTAIAKLAFPRQANGSLVIQDGKVRGSELIGQSFEDPGHFWGRLSATSPVPYNAGASTGSNLGPTNPELTKNASTRIEALRAVDPTNRERFPVDLVTSSASGLDPHISAEAARIQTERVARTRRLSEGRVRSLVEAHTETGLFGEPRVNVLLLNLALERL